GDPASRRRFLDDLLVVLMPRNAAIRQEYDRVLKQRNALLKSARSARFSRGGVTEGHLSTLDVWDAHLAAAAANLLAARLDLVERLRPHMAEAYAQLTDGSKLLRGLYRSSLDPAGDAGGQDDAGTPDAGGFPRAASASEAQDLSLCTVEELTALYVQTLAASRPRELERGMSLVGPHRDELELLLGQAPARGYASHGESWSVALAMRLASYYVLDEDSRIPDNQPILILDDVFAELDVQRRRKLAAMVGGAEQVLVTAAVAGDIPAELAGAQVQVIPGGVVPGSANPGRDVAHDGP
ncbi:MAG TPA: DNA replication and repair protein RecF, partial [Micrococcaceae bacterium]